MCVYHNKWFLMIIWYIEWLLMIIWYIECFCMIIKHVKWFWMKKITFNIFQRGVCLKWWKCKNRGKCTQGYWIYFLWGLCTRCSHFNNGSGVRMRTHNETFYKIGFSPFEFLNLKNGTWRKPAHKGFVLCTRTEICVICWIHIRLKVNNEALNHWSNYCWWIIW